MLGVTTTKAADVPIERIYRKNSGVLKCFYCNGRHMTMNKTWPQLLGKSAVTSLSTKTLLRATAGDVGPYLAHQHYVLIKKIRDCACRKDEAFPRLDRLGRLGRGPNLDAESTEAVVIHLYPISLHHLWRFIGRRVRLMETTVRGLQFYPTTASIQFP